MGQNFRVPKFGSRLWRNPTSLTGISVGSESFSFMQSCLAVFSFHSLMPHQHKWDPKLSSHLLSFLCSSHVTFVPRSSHMSIINCLTWRAQLCTTFWGHFCNSPQFIIYFCDRKLLLIIHMKPVVPKLWSKCQQCSICWECGQSWQFLQQPPPSLCDKQKWCVSSWDCLWEIAHWWPLTHCHIKCL